MATQNEIAKHIDLSDRQVRTLIKSGVLPAGSGAGGLDLDACRLAYIRYMRGKATGRVEGGAATDLDPQKERARLVHHQANIAALEEKQIKGDLLRADEVAGAWESVLTNFRAKMLALPTKLAGRLAGYDQAAVMEISDRVVKEALDELSGYEIPETKSSNTDGPAAA